MKRPILPALFLLLGLVTCDRDSSAIIHGITAPAFNNGVASRGLLMWEPDGVDNSSCTPSNCYNVGTASNVLNATKLAKLSAAHVGHIRYGVGLSPLMSDPSNTASYLGQIFGHVDLLLAQNMKVVLNFTPNINWAGFDPTAVADGVGGTKFTLYKTAITAAATYIASHLSSYPPNRVAISLLNEWPSGVSGGNDAIYAMNVALYQAVRAVLGNHTIIVCGAGFCGMFDIVQYAGWNNMAAFDKNTVFDIHSYVPPVAGFACEANSFYRDTCNIVYPPITANYATYEADYETALAADDTWAGDCPAGPDCVAARDANKATMEDAGSYEGLKCYAGAGGGFLNCNTPQTLTWLRDTFFVFVENWRTGMTPVVAANRIYIGENGITGPQFCDGTGTIGLSYANQALALTDVAAAIDFYGFSRATLGVECNPGDGNGSAWGMMDPNTPWNFVNPDAMTGLNFNGQ